MKTSRKTRSGATKTFLSVTLICAMFATYTQPGFAIALSGQKIHAQLLGVLTSTSTSSSQTTNNRIIVRDNLGLSGLNLTCLLLGCNVLESLGDPGGQLFVVQSLGNPVPLLNHLLSAVGIVDAEPDHECR